MSKRVKLVKNNICGKWIRHVRKGLYDKQHPKMTQEELSAKLQVLGLKIDRTLPQITEFVSLVAEEEARI